MVTLAEALEQALGLTRAGQPQQAEQIYAEVLRQKPEQPQALYLWGRLANETARHALAADLLSRAVAADPHNSVVHVELGRAYQSLGRAAEALDAYQRACKLGGETAAVWYHQGLAFDQLGRADEALSAYQRAIELDPQFAAAHNNLGTVWQDCGDVDRARQHYLAAIACASDYADPHYNLGTMADEAHDLAAAERHYRDAVQVDPRHVLSHYNLAVTLARAGQDTEALAAYDAVLALAPEHAEAHFGRGALWMRAGNFATGWTELEWRARSASYVQRHFREPLWDGTPLPEQTLLVHSDEAVGDTFQFVRYLPQAAERCRQLIVEVAPGLVRFLSQSGLPGKFCATGDSLPEFDQRVPLLSLPSVFGTSLDSIPADVPYLAADRALIDAWHQRLASIDGLRVGIHWQGRPNYVDDYARSIPLAAFEPLSRVAGARLISLQKRVGTEQLAAARERFDITVLPDDVDEQAGFFMDTAAIMKNLDLVITSDTATAHLAGALGVPVWVALSFAAEWRWLAEREDSPWYPTMRLFRQRVPGDWDELFARIAESLSQLAQSRSERSDA